MSVNEIFIEAYENHAQDSRVRSVGVGSCVRRLTTVECARLQGFPDRHTEIPWRNKPAEKCPKGRQYKAYGNSMCVAVIEWLGRKVEQEINHDKNLSFRPHDGETGL